MKSLLEIAKAIPARSLKQFKYSDDDIELVKAWVRNEIGLSQLQQAKKFASSQAAYSYIALVCREILIKNGELK